MDVNTNATQTRTVTLKLKVKPGKERNIASVTFQASSTLAPAEALETSIIIDRDQHGEPAAFELLQKEPPLKVLPVYGVGGDQ